MKVTELEEYLYERGYYTSNGSGQTKIYSQTAPNKRKFVGRIWHADTRTNFKPIETIDVAEVVLQPEYKSLGTLILLLGIAVEVTHKVAP